MIILVFVFLRTGHTALHSGCTNLPPTHSTGGSAFPTPCSAFALCRRLSWWPFWLVGGGASLLLGSFRVCDREPQTWLRSATLASQGKIELSFRPIPGNPELGFACAQSSSSLPVVLCSEGEGCDRCRFFGTSIGAQHPVLPARPIWAGLWLLPQPRMVGVRPPQPPGLGFERGQRPLWFRGSRAARWEVPPFCGKDPKERPWGSLEGRGIRLSPGFRTFLARHQAYEWCLLRPSRPRPAPSWTASLDPRQQHKNVKELPSWVLRTFLTHRIVSNH